MLHLAVRQDILGKTLPTCLRTNIRKNLSARQVQFSEVDFYGHVNNTRYLDWCLDAIPAEWHRDYRVRSMVINFLSEVRYGENIRVEYLVNDGSINFQGIREEDGKAIYRAEYRIG